ncbi:MAG: phage tail sheath family protein [Gammaproteobacteria bacterium]
MVTYSTPGVYVREISTFPPSVAEVSTAVPVFIGYTELGPAANKPPKVVRINTLLEYQAHFGDGPFSSYKVKAKLDSQTKRWTLSGLERTKTAGEGDYMLYDSLNLFFKNGGGSCYIISVGNYKDSPAKARFEAGLEALEREDEPTLILMPDALNVSEADYYDLCQQALALCKKLGDRFSILDVPEGDGQISAFREGIGTDSLMYGAAYYPYLHTTLTYLYKEGDVAVETDAPEGTSADDRIWTGAFPEGGSGISVTYTGTVGDNPKVKVVAGDANQNVSFTVSAQVLTVNDASGKTGAQIAAAWTAWIAEPHDDGGFAVVAGGDGSGSVPSTQNANVDLTLQTQAPQASSMAVYRQSETALYNQLKTLLNEQRITLPSSAAVAGVYSRVDRDRGVWKAPANVSLSSVIGPAVKITDEEQGGLNIDANAGKSINAVRAFTGKGTLVWGARTLAGNDNEWRYISVRRLFNMIEESTKRATGFAVFEPNDATTWLKVKAMIESYLFGLWERGALAGSTPEAAYFVNVGLGKTMTTQDILEGRLNVEIGIAAVRPAEFIILKFSHKLQEA